MTRTPKFTDTHVRKAKPGKSIHVFDVPNLYLYVSPKGVKRYFYRYTVPRVHRGNRKQPVTTTSVGRPGIDLNRAKVIAAKYAELLRDGIDPQEAKRWHHAESMTFGQLAEQYIEHHKPGWSPKRLQDARNLLLVHGKPLVDLVLKDITSEKVHSALAALWEKHTDQAQRARLMIEHMLDYAKVKRLRSGENPARWRGNLQHLFPKRQHIAGLHHASMPYGQVPIFLQELRTHRGSVAVALEFCILTACRSSEVLQARWSEFDLPNVAHVQHLTPTWTIPASRMKARNPHRVPLSDRAVELLKRQQERSGKSVPWHVFDNSKPRASAGFDSGFVFTGNRRDQPLAERTMYFLLRSMVPGVTVHGFRGSFRNWASHAFPGDRNRGLAELCLGHTVKSQVEGAYWTDDMLEERRPIMQAWADFCCSN
jgi:integrase